MSSWEYRNVSISQNELSRLRDEANRASALARQNAEIQENARRREYEIQRQHQADLNSLNDSIRRESTARDEQVRQISNDFRNRLARQGEQLQRNIQTVENHVNALSNDMNQRFQELQRQQEGKETRARRNLQLLDEILETIRSLRPSKFTSGELEALLELRTNAINNINVGDFEAAISTIEQGVRDGGRTAARLNYLNNVFNELLETARVNISNLQMRLESFGPQGGGVTLDFNLDGQEYHWDYDITHWAEKPFKEVAVAYEALRREVESAPTSDLNIEGLEALIGNIQQTDLSLSACDQAGRDALIRSTVAEDFAVRIHNVLAEQGWIPQETGRHENDDRNPYRMIYGDGSGNEVAIVVADGDKPDTPSYIVDVYADTEVARRITFDALRDGLERNGVAIPQGEYHENCESNPTATDFVENTANQIVRAHTQYGS